MLFTSYRTPRGGEILCIGRTDHATDGEGRHVLRFSQLSTLGACPAGGSGTITGCVR